MKQNDDGMWFRPKALGYGAGLPLAWQGWALLAAYIAVMAGAAWLIEWDQDIGMMVGVPAMVLATVILIFVSKAKTRGGWKWRG